MRPGNTLELEHLMTVHAPIGGAPQPIDASLTIFDTGVGGTVSGPRIRGEIVAPTADWLRAMPSGTLRVDARMSIATDDGARIYASYGGVIRIAPADFARMSSGAELGPEEMYFVTTPVFQTADERYAWLTEVQTVAKAVALKGGAGGFVRYAVFAVR